MRNQKIAWLLVGLLALACIWLVAENTGLHMKLQMLEQQAMAQKAIMPAKISVEQIGGATFNFSDVVAPDGSVANTTTKMLALKIANDEFDKPVKVLVTLYNPKTGERGLPKELQNSYVEVFLNTGNINKTLYADGKFTDGETFTLSPASSITLNLGVTLLKAPAGTFADNQTYTLNVYISQPDAGYWTQVASYTLTT